MAFRNIDQSHPWLQFASGVNMLGTHLADSLLAAHLECVEINCTDPIVSAIYYINTSVSHDRGVDILFLSFRRIIFRMTKPWVVFCPTFVSLQVSSPFLNSWIWGFKKCGKNIVSLGKHTRNIKYTNWSLRLFLRSQLDNLTSEGNCEDTSWD